MAGGVSTVSAIGNILKDRYLGPIRDQFSRNRVLEEILGHNREDIDGNSAVIPIRILGNPAIGYRGDNGALPAAGKQTYEKVSVTMAYLYGRCSFTGPAIAASKSNAGAFAKIMDDEMKNLVEDFRQVANHFNYGDGSGALAICAAGTAASTIYVDRWSKLFTVGRILDSYTAKSAGSQGMNSGVITAVDKAALTITISSHGASVGDYLFLEDTRGVCQMGLLGIVDDATFLTTHQGLSRETYPIWKGKVLSNSGTSRTISESLLMDANALLSEDKIEPNLMIGTIFQRNDLIKTLQMQRQFTNPDKKLKGGIRAIDICDTPFTWDPDCPAGYCFVGDTSVLEFYEQGPLNWMDKDGAVLNRIEGYDAYEATLFMYRELGSSRNNAWCRIQDLAENRPSGY